MSENAKKALLIDIDGMLVRTGKYRGEESAGDVRPAAVLDSIAEVPGWWPGR